MLFLKRHVIIGAISSAIEKSYHLPSTTKPPAYAPVAKQTDSKKLQNPSSLKPWRNDRDNPERESAVKCEINSILYRKNVKLYTKLLRSY